MTDPRRTTGTAFTRAWPVLYVDDEPGNLLPFTLQFRDEFEILTADSGSSALEVLESSPVAVLLTDHRMPGMTGVDLCERVRDRWPDVLRLLVTAYSDQQIAIDAINRGGVLRYITKPWKPDEVRQILRGAIARASLERTVRKLRTAIMDKERLVALTAVRARLIQDLARTNVSVGACCDNLEGLEGDLQATVEPDVFDTYQTEVHDLRRYVDYLDDLHDRGEDGVGYARPKRQEHRLDHLLATVARLARTDLEHLDSLLVECPADATVYADSTDVSRVLVNLISNCARAVSEQSGSGARVGVQVRRAGGTIDIMVWDEGPPIPVEMRDVLFDPYHGIRASGTGRAGVELVVCRELALANGGTIEVAAEVGAGRNAFRLLLPACQPTSRPVLVDS